MARREPVFSDDPKAVEKLTEDVGHLENLQKTMKASNAAIRKHAKAGPDAQHAALVALGHPPERAHKLLQPDFAGRVGFPDYAIKNNNANIRRLKGRTEEIKLSKASFSPEFQAKADAHTAEKAKAAINDYYSKSVGAGPVFTGPDKEAQRKDALAKGAAAAMPKGGDIVDVAAASAAKAYSSSYKDALGKGADEKSARTTAHQARQEAHKQAISEHLSQGKPKAAHDPAHAARRAEAERATAHKLDKIGEDLHEQHLSGEKSAEQINEEHALHKERLIKEHLEKSAPAAPKSAQEQHAEKLKTFAASGKAAESSKRVGQMLTSRKMTAAVKSPGEKQAPIQTSARGAKFYVSRAGEKVYVK